MLASFYMVLLWNSLSSPSFCFNLFIQLLHVSYFCLVNLVADFDKFKNFCSRCLIYWSSKVLINPILTFCSFWENFNPMGTFHFCKWGILNFNFAICSLWVNLICNTFFHFAAKFNCKGIYFSIDWQIIPSCSKFICFFC